MSNTVVFGDPYADVQQFGTETKGRKGGSGGKTTTTDFDYDYKYVFPRDEDWYHAGIPNAFGLTPDTATDYGSEGSHALNPNVPPVPGGDSGSGSGINLPGGQGGSGVEAGLIATGVAAGAGVAGIAGSLASRSIRGNTGDMSGDIALDELSTPLLDDEVLRAEGKIPITDQPMAAETEGLFQQTLEGGASGATETAGAAESSGGILETALGVVQGIGDTVAGGTAEALGGGAVAEGIGSVVGGVAEGLSVLGGIFF